MSQLHLHVSGPWSPRPHPLRAPASPSAAFLGLVGLRAGRLQAPSALTESLLKPQVASYSGRIAFPRRQQAGEFYFFYSRFKVLFHTFSYFLGHSVSPSRQIKSLHEPSCPVSAMVCGKNLAFDVTFFPPGAAKSPLLARLILRRSSRGPAGGGGRGDTGKERVKTCPSWFSRAASSLRYPWDKSLAGSVPLEKSARPPGARKSIRAGGGTGGLIPRPLLPVL